MNTSKRRAESTNSAHESHKTRSHEFSDDDIDDSDLVQVARGGDLDFRHIDSYGDETTSTTRRNTAANGKREDPIGSISTTNDGETEPRQLDNGKWACNHRCNDKSACKHLCCREGLDKPPKPARNPATAAADKAKTAQQLSKSQMEPAGSQKTQSKLKLTSTKKNPLMVGQSSPGVPHLDLSIQEASDDDAKRAPRDYKKLQTLHTSVQRGPQLPVMSLSRKRPTHAQTNEDPSSLFFLPAVQEEEQNPTSSDYGDNMVVEQTPPSPSTGDEMDVAVTPPPDIDHPHNMEDTDRIVYDDDEEMLEAAMVGLADSQDIRAAQINPSLNSIDRGRSDQTNCNQGFALPWPETTVHRQDVAALPTASPEGTAPFRPRLPRTEKSLFVGEDTSSPSVVENAAKPGIVGVKRTSTTAQVQQGVRDPPKRRKVEEGGDRPVRSVEESPPDSGSVYTAPEAVVVPPGYEDVDPELLREFGEYVEFV